MKKNVPFSADQRKITVLCMIAYSVLYCMRLNISPVLASLGADLGFSTVQLGGISTAFFWCYALGQLINGFFGDRLPTRYMIFAGLLGSGVLNILMGVSSNYILLVILWGVNGIFQSMLWSPMVKCIAQYFDETRRVIASFALSVTQVIGYMLAWTGSYELNSFFGWRFAFIVPACLGILYAFVWLFSFRFRTTLPAKERKSGPSLIRQPILLGFLGVIALFSVLFGLIKSSIDTWLPTMLTDFGKLPDNAIVITLLVLPLVNFLGIMLAKSFVKRLKGDIYKSVLVLWVGSVVVCLISLLLFNVHPTAVVIGIAVLFGFIYGQTPLFTSFIPLDFSKWNCVSTVTGFVDFAIYLGAAVTGVVSGAVLGDSYNWSALCIFWMCILLVGLVFAIGVYVWHHKIRKKISMEEQEWD